jgi:hypothetical protein
LQANGGSSSSDEDVEDDLPVVDLATGNKDTYVLEVDDSEDIEIITELIDPSPPMGFDMSNLDGIFGYDDFIVTKQQMFTHIWRCRIPALTLRQLATHFERILRVSGSHFDPCLFCATQCHGANPKYFSFVFISVSLFQTPFYETLCHQQNSFPSRASGSR